MARKEMKRAYMLLLWEILKEETDENNQLTINEILKLFFEKIDQNPDRKTIIANIDDLIELGYPIGIGSIREKKEKTATVSRTYYFDRSKENSNELTDAQLFILADSIFDSKFVKSDEADKIATWIFEHGSKSFRDTYEIERSEDYGHHVKSSELFKVIDAFDKAERENKQLRIDYYEFDMDGKLELQEQGIVLNAYYTVISNGYYYLVGKREKENEYSHYRIDKIKYPKVLKKDRLAIDRDFDISEYKNYHIDMSCDSNNIASVILKVNKDFLHFIYDNTETKPTIIEKTKEYTKIRFEGSIDKIRNWSLQHSDKIEVVEPQTLRQEIFAIASQLQEKYK